MQKWIIFYDGFYKYVLDPERNPERLEGFLTELFGQTVIIEQVLPKEGTKLEEQQKEIKELKKELEESRKKDALLRDQAARIVELEVELKSK